MSSFHSIAIVFDEEHLASVSLFQYSDFGSNQRNCQFLTRIYGPQKTNAHVGSNFEDFLLEEGRLDEATALAVKRVLAWELQKAMKQQNVSKAELARRMKTSRAVIHRLLDENDPSVTLATITRAARVLGRSVRLKLAA
jgi:antitoxin HicB